MLIERNYEALTTVQDKRAGRMAGAPELTIEASSIMLPAWFVASITKLEEMVVTVGGLIIAPVHIRL